MPYDGDLYPRPSVGYSPKTKNDLFASLSVNRYRDVVDRLERKVDELVANRHEYPIWPRHNEPLDPYEASFHGLIRRPYYRVTIELIHVLRALRELA